MSSLKDFKSIADEFMADIKAGDELKKKTLRSLRNNKTVFTGKLLAAAACLVLILGIARFSGVLPQTVQNGNKGNQENNIMMVPDDSKAGILPGQNPAGTAAKPGGGMESKGIVTMEEAGKIFGEGFLVPSYIPAGFESGTISISGTEDIPDVQVVISYNSGKKSYLVIEEKPGEKFSFNNYKKVDINGAEGFIKPETDNADIGVSDTEVHWFKNGVHYSVSGLITGEEALKVALSMK